MSVYRGDFPIFQTEPSLVYLDSAATTLKPRTVIDKITAYYRDYSSNIYRGLYPIAEKASAEYERSRQTVADFIHAQSLDEIVFTKGATEALNLLATSLSGMAIKEHAKVLTTIVEHHANFVPWQQAAIKHKAKFGVVTFHPTQSTKEQILEAFRLSITKETSILAFTYVSNVLGLVLPAKEIIQIARSINPKMIIILDACQAIQHIPIDVQDLDCDFMAFSGHKIFGPTGVGVLYGKKARLEALPPYQFGGDMIEEVAVEQTTFANPPHKFEAGTPPIAEVIGLGEAIRYVESTGLKAIESHTQKLRLYSVQKLRESFGKGIEIYESEHMKCVNVIAFNLFGCHPHDVAQIVGEENVCIRVGHHCAQPLHTYLDIPATCRMSFSIYNTQEDVDFAISKLRNVLEVLRPRNI